MVLLNGADDVKIGDTQVIFISLGQVRVWPPGTGEQPILSNISAAGTLTVSWGSTEFAESYELRRNGTLIATQASRVYTDTGLAWNGKYSYTVTPISFGIPGDESTPSITATIPKGTQTSLSASSRSYTNVTISWGAVTGATQYKVYRNGSLYSTQTSRSKAVATSANTTITIYVVPYRNGVAGNAGRTYSYYSGRAESRDSGSKTMEFGPSKLDSWRSVDGWNWLSGIAAQGYFTASYGSYRGVIYYGSAGVRDSLRSQLGGGTTGTNRQAYGTCTDCDVRLYKKTGTGSSGAVTIGIQLTNSTASGAAPSGASNANRTSSNSGITQWYDIPDGHGQALGDGTYKSLMIRQDGSGNYAHFTDGRLKLIWSWNYVTVSAKSNTWS